jgi:hypothetical protein
MPGESVNIIRADYLRAAAITLGGSVAARVHCYTYAVVPEPSSNNTATGAAGRCCCGRLPAGPRRLPRRHGLPRICGTLATRHRLVGLADASARAARLHLRNAGRQEHAKRQTDLQKTTFHDRHFLEASQPQLALPENVPLRRPDASRPFQYWVVTAFFRVKVRLVPLIWPVIVPMSCHDVPAKLPLTWPPDVSTKSNSPSHRPPVQSDIQRQ